MRDCQIWDKFNAERQALRIKLAEQLRLNMSFLVGFSQKIKKLN